VGYRRQRQGTLAMDDLVQRQRIVAECRGLIDEGFDGVHLNVEPVPDNSLEFLALLRSLQTAVHPGILSVSAIRPGAVALPFAPNFFWTPAYYGRVARIADQIVVMAYDTALPTANAYRRYLAWSAQTVSEALDDASSECRVLMGVPTYDPRGMMHREGVETPENALAGIVQGLRGRSGGTFEGVALYAEWTTSEEDWDVYDRVWRGRHAR
jgi:spore germination protein YaaH